MDWQSFTKLFICTRTLTVLLTKMCTRVGSDFIKIREEKKTVWITFQFRRTFFLMIFSERFRKVSKINYRNRYIKMSVISIILCNSFCQFSKYNLKKKLFWTVRLWRDGKIPWPRHRAFLGLSFPTVPSVHETRNIPEFREASPPNKVYLLFTCAYHLWARCPAPVCSDQNLESNKFTRHLYLVSYQHKVTEIYFKNHRRIPRKNFIVKVSWFVTQSVAKHRSSFPSSVHWSSWSVAKAHLLLDPSLSSSLAFLSLVLELTGVVKGMRDSLLVPTPMTAVFMTKWHPCQSSWDTLAPGPLRKNAYLITSSALSSGKAGCSEFCTPSSSPFPAN